MGILSGRPIITSTQSIELVKLTLGEGHFQNLLALPVVQHIQSFAMVKTLLKLPHRPCTEETAASKNALVKNAKAERARGNSAHGLAGGVVPANGVVTRTARAGTAL